MTAHSGGVPRPWLRMTVSNCSNKKTQFESRIGNIEHIPLCEARGLNVGCREQTVKASDGRVAL